jgi:hypothetical protein
MTLELMKNGPGEVEVFFEFRRHLGPRFVHGAVRLQFDSSQPYSFVSEAKWPEKDNYEAVVRSAVEQVLLERIGSLEKVSVVLRSITFHPVDSSAEGFRRAARAATEAAFNTSQS